MRDHFKGFDFTMPITRTGHPLLQAACLAADIEFIQAAIDAGALIDLSALLTASSVGSSSSSVQLLYQTLFSLWSLSYSPAAALEMANSKLGIVPKLVEITKTSPKEKVR